MCRLSDGELPGKAPKLIVLLIGNNDLSYIYNANSTLGEAPLLAEVEPLVQRCGVHAA